MTEMRYSEDIGSKVIVAAARFLGLTEIRSNDKWDNLETAGLDDVGKELREELLRVGWQSTWPYCMAFCEAVWTRAYQGRAELMRVRQMLTPGCLQSWRNAVAAGWTESTPRTGSIGVMRKGDTIYGHAFIVRTVQNETLYTIEANTSPALDSAEAEREGDGVYKKTRRLHFQPTTGLHLLGFITPMTESE